MPYLPPTREFFTKCYTYPGISDTKQPLSESMGLHLPSWEFTLIHIKVVYLYFNLTTHFDKKIICNMSDCEFQCKRHLGEEHVYAFELSMVDILFYSHRLWYSLRLPRDVSVITMLCSLGFNCRHEATILNTISLNILIQSLDLSKTLLWIIYKSVTNSFPNYFLEGIVTNCFHILVGMTEEGKHVGRWRNTFVLNWRSEHSSIIAFHAFIYDLHILNELL